MSVVKGKTALSKPSTTWRRATGTRRTSSIVTSEPSTDIVPRISSGGPIVRNKAHFFVSVERQVDNPNRSKSFVTRPDKNFAIAEDRTDWNTLLRIDPTDRTGTRPVPDLAESWTVTPDGLTYTFKLRQGVRFHDGSLMTSRDVKASYDKIIFPPAGVISMRKGSYQAVEVVEALDPHTVRFRLKWPEASFLTSVSSPYNWILKADNLAKDMRWYETNVMGTGPFKFVEYVRGSHWVGKKNPDYWDKGKPYLDGFRALFIPSASAQVAAIRGERAMIQFRSFTPADRDSLVAALGNKITVQESPWNCSIGITPNEQKKPYFSAASSFDTSKVTESVSLAPMILVWAMMRASPSGR